MDRVRGGITLYRFREDRKGGRRGRKVEGPGVSQDRWNLRVG